MNRNPTATEARELAERAFRDGPAECLTLAVDLMLRSYRMHSVEGLRAARREAAAT